MVIAVTSCDSRSMFAANKIHRRFNVHSPLNNVAGWSTGRSMSQLREFYEKQNDKEEAELQEKIKKRNEGKEEPKEYIASIKAT